MASRYSAGRAYALPIRLARQGYLMTKPMSAPNLIQCLAGELLVDPSLMLETIREEEDLMRVVRSYRLGDFTYSDVLDTVKDFF